MNCEIIEQQITDVRNQFLVLNFCSLDASVYSPTLETYPLYMIFEFDLVHNDTRFP